MSLTLVTGFWDLNKYENRLHEKNKANYMEWAKLIFGLDINIVFFVSKEDSFYIWKERNNRGFSNKTLILEREFNELPFWGLHSDFTKFRAEKPIGNTFYGKDSVNYSMVTLSKVYLVEEVIDSNPFGTDYFGWIDFGLNHVVKGRIPENLAEILKPTTKKIKILQLRAMGNSEFDSLESYFRLHRLKIAGGLWIGHTSTMKIFINLFKKYLYQAMSYRVCTLEEEIFSLLLHKHRDIFSTYYGDYYQILNNYEKLVEPVDLIFDLIRDSIFLKQYNFSFGVAYTVFRDCNIKLDYNKKVELVDNMLNCVNHINVEAYKFYKREVKDEIEGDINFLEYIIGNQENINNLIDKPELIGLLSEQVIKMNY
jgi:hypothetical protein